MDLSNRRKSIVRDDEPVMRRSSSKTKSGAMVTSEMQAILTIKENNESKAANLIADFLASKAERTYDERLLMKNLDDLLNGFTTDEKLRIISAALVRALCKIS